MTPKSEAVIDEILEDKLYHLSIYATEAGKKPEEVAKKLGIELPRGVRVAQYPGPEALLQEAVAEIKALLEVKELLQKQHTETKANFLAIEKRDAHSSKQNLWLTFTSSAISLILGWLLSLLGSPATLVHAFGR